MTANELKPCPFCGGEATAVPDASHSTGWTVGCFSRFCAVEPNVWAVHKSTAELQWNARVDINQAVSVQDKWEEIDSTMTRIVEAERDAAIAHAEKAVAKLAKALEMLGKFCSHYPIGINPYLDDAYINARAVLAEERKP